MMPGVMIVHRASGRLRLRVASRRADAAWLRATARRIAEVPGVLAVEMNVSTASFLVRHPISEDVEPALRDLDIWSFEYEDPARPPPLEVLSGTVAELNTYLRRISAHQADLQTLTFLLLIGLSIAQILRGKIMAPAASMLWYALELAALSRSATMNRSDDTSRPAP
ncbi:MAG: hypothetical protein K9L70_06640 [Thiohalocapsa sp.]|nr:hypothetical protein [Thiohalocapsa sp.]MCF7990797.1 hypothetical protein [Thiohalocapsa sp.]